MEQLAQAPEDELWLIADGSDLRKPYAEAMPALMQVRDLEGNLVPGYRTQSAAGRDTWTAGYPLSSVVQQRGPWRGLVNRLKCSRRGLR